MADTGGGGQHRWLDGCPEITKNIKLPGGIDVLVSGAVIMAPSMHISGKRYCWRTEPETPRPKLTAGWRDYILKFQAGDSGNKTVGIVVPAGEIFDPMRGRVTATGATFDTLGQLPSGARNAEVTRVIGAMLAAGQSAEAVLAAGRRWAEAQVPPYSLADLRSKVRWIANRHGSTGGGWCDDDPEPLDGEPADRDAAEEEDGSQPITVDGLSANPEFLAALAELGDVSTPHTPTGQLPSPPAAAEEEVLTAPAPLLLPPQTSLAAVGGPASSSASSSATSFATTSSAAAPANSKSYLPPTVKPEAEPQTATGELLLPPPAVPRLSNTPTPVQRPNDVPPGVPPAVCHGLFGEYLMAVWRLTEAGPFGVLMCAITAFGSAVGRLPHLLAGGVQRTNLFLLLVGDTADRKGTAWSVGGEPIRLADPQWADARIIPGFGSGEGLVFAIRDDQEQQQPVKEKGVTTGYATVTVPGVTDKRLLCIEEEFRKLLTLMDRETSTLSAIIIPGWDSKPVGFLNKTSQDRCREPHLSVLAMMTPKSLVQRTAGRQAAEDGSLNRFLLCRVRRHGFLPFGGDWQAVAAAFAPRFQAALQKARSIGQVGWTPDARTLWEQEYERLSAGREGDFGGVTARRADQTLRLALIYALADGSDVIGLEHLRAALALYEHCDQTARELYGTPQAVAPAAVAEAAEEPLHVQLLAVIRQQPGIRRSDLTRRFSHTPATAVQPALDLLKEYNLAFPRMTATAGRQAECWYPTDGTTADGLTGCGGVDDDDEAAGLPAAEEEVQRPNGFGSPSNGAEKVVAEEEVQQPKAGPLLLPPQGGTAESQTPEFRKVGTITETAPNGEHIWEVRTVRTKSEPVQRPSANVGNSSFLPPPAVVLHTGASSSTAQPASSVATTAVSTTNTPPPVKPDEEYTFEDALRDLEEQMFQ